MNIKTIRIPLSRSLARRLAPNMFLQLILIFLVLEAFIYHSWIALWIFTPNAITQTANVYLIAKKRKP